MTARISHATRKAMTKKVIDDVKGYVLNAGKTVKIDQDLYELIGNVRFNSFQIFALTIKNALMNDPEWQVTTAKKKGTFVSHKTVEHIVPENVAAVRKGGKVGRPCKAKKVQMGGNFGIAPYTMTGKIAEVELNDETWKLCKKTPKTFNGPDVVEVYKMDIMGRPTEYAQVVKGGKVYHFTVDAK